MAHVKQTKLSAAMVFNNQRRFSEKLHKRALRAIKVVSECYDKFEIKDDHDETFLFNQLNHYYWDLTQTIFNLQQILIDSGKPSNPSAINLKKLLGELNTITSSIQESLQLEPEKLKLKLKEVVDKVSFQFEILMKIIALENLHEYKQRMLDCQLGLVISTEKLKMAKEFRNLSFAEIVKYAHDLTNDVNSTCNQIKIGYENLEEDFSHYVRINMLHMHYNVYYLHQLRNSGYFKGSLNAIFKQVEKIAIEYIDGITNSVEYDNPIQKLAVYFKNCHDMLTMATSEIEKGLDENGQQNFDVKELIFYLYVNGLNGLHSLNETIKDALVKN